MNDIDIKLLRLLEEQKQFLLLKEKDASKMIVVASAVPEDDKLIVDSRSNNDNYPKREKPFLRPLTQDEIRGLKSMVSR